MVLFPEDGYFTIKNRLRTVEYFLILAAVNYVKRTKDSVSIDYSDLRSVLGPMEPLSYEEVTELISEVNRTRIRELSL